MIRISVQNPRPSNRISDPQDSNAARNILHNPPSKAKIHTLPLCKSVNIAPCLDLRLPESDTIFFWPANYTVQRGERLAKKVC